MSTQQHPTISSFVIRFVVEAAMEHEPAQPVFHGAIRHVQSDETANFSLWEDAVAFIQRFVPLDAPPAIKPTAEK